jgi:hypothetical protein
MFERYRHALQRIGKDRRWWFYYLQREFTLKAQLRNRIASIISYTLPKTKPFRPCEEARTAAQQLKEQGFAPLGNFLSEPEVKTIFAHFRTKFCYDAKNPGLPGFRDPKDAHSTCYHAYYSSEDMVHAPGLLAIANHSTVLQAIEARLGCKPTISQIAGWWLLANYDYSDGAAETFRHDARTLHRDIDDWASLKLFLYLTDVDEFAAPHVFLEGSHNGSLEDEVRTLDLEKARRLYPNQIHTFTGPAGTAWLEDTFGLHVGTKPEKRDRLMICVAYSLFSVPFSTTTKRKWQPETDTVVYDPYINRLWLSA